MPVHGTRMILMSDGYCNLIEPARSAAVYPQKLQQNAMMIGSKSSFIIPPLSQKIWTGELNLSTKKTPVKPSPILQNAFEQRVHLAQYLIVFIPIEFDGLGRTFSSTDTTSMAQRNIDFTDAVFIDSRYLIRTRPDAYEA